MNALEEQDRKALDALHEHELECHRRYGELHGKVDEVNRTLGLRIEEIAGDLKAVKASLTSLTWWVRGSVGAALLAATKDFWEKLL